MQQLAVNFMSTNTIISAIFDNALQASSLDIYMSMVDTQRVFSMQTYNEQTNITNN